MALDTSLYYSLDKIEKKNCLFNAIITLRGGGKTFAIKRRMIEKGLQGKKFVYLRRRDRELQNDKMRLFFDKIQSCGYYPDHKLEYDKGIFYCDGKIIGYGTSLSTSVNERSVDFVGVTDVYFEEFVLHEDGVHKYLNDEVITCLEMYSTIARDENVRMWFLGNKIQEFNPYFLYFDIKPPKKGIKVWNDFAVEVWDNPDIINAKKETRFGKLVNGTAYGDYAIDNIALESQESFIIPLPKGSSPFYHMYADGHLYTLWKTTSNGVCVSECGTRYKIKTFVLNQRDNQPGVDSIEMFKYSPFGVYYKNALIHNKLFYTSGKCEEIARQLSRKIYFRR